MKKMVIGGAVVAGIILLLLIGIAGYYYFVIFGNNDRTLARNVAVTSEWTEIKIDPPVKPVYNHQAIYIRPINFKVDRSAKGFEIKLPDETVVDPQIEISDQHGKTFQINKEGFAMGLNDYVEFWPGGANDSWALPRNRAYTSVRIRSGVPFVCDEILWIDYSPP